MSHSQFHSTNLFILRHAWLNLWDKHMTTGRINQVTTFYNRAESPIQLLLFSSKELNFAEESSLTIGKCWSQLVNAFNRSILTDSSYNQTALFPGLTILRHILLVTEAVTNINAFDENYQQPALSTKDYTQSRRIFSWLSATGLAISK